MAQIGEYAKSLTYIVGAAAGVFQAGLSDGALSTVEVINAVIAGVGVIPVYWVTKQYYLKAISVGVVAALQAVVILLADKLNLGAIDGSEWSTVLLTGLFAAGVLIIPNTPPKPAVFSYNPVNAGNVVV